MLITKKMMQDMKKNSNLLVCDECGSEDIEEQVWVDINSYLVLDNKHMHRFYQQMMNISVQDVVMKQGMENVHL